MSEKIGSVPTAVQFKNQRLTIISGSFTIGGAGAITAQSADGAATVSKTAGKTGRYDIATYREWDRIVFDANIIGPTDTGIGNTNGNALITRNVMPNPTPPFSPQVTSQGQIQAILASTGVDTDMASGIVVEWWAFCYGH